MLSRRLILGAALIAVTCVVAACGTSATTSDQTGGGGATTTVTVTTTVPTVTTTPTATVTTPTTTGTTTTGATATDTTTTGTGTNPTTTATSPTNTLDGLPECVAADLTPSFLGTNGAAGTIALGFALKNTSSSSCSTYGWPGVEFLDSSGTGLSTNYVRTSSDIFGSTPAKVIALASGQQASFRLIASDFAASSSCSNASALQIISPNDTATMSVPISGGVPACGKETLSPMMTGTSAWPKQ
jgi:Protein of unknown function (DUF4232)